MSEKMKDSGVDWIGEIPEGWEVSKIKYVAELDPVKSEIIRENFIGKKVTFLPMDKLKKGHLILDSVADFIEVFSSYNYFAEGDILFAKVTPSFENGNIGIAKNLRNGIGFGSSEIYTLRAHNIDTNFLYYWLQNQQFKSEAVSNMYGVAGLKRVPAEFIKNHVILLPISRVDQKAVADYLDKQTSKFDQAQKLLKDEIERLRAYKKSLIYETVTKGLDKNVQFKDSGVDWIGEIPVGWEVVSLKNIVQIKNGREIEKSVNKGYPVYGSGGVFKYTDKYLYDGESVLLGRKGTIDNPQYVTGKFWTVDTSYYTISSGRLCTKLFYYQSLLFDYQFFQTGSTLPSMTQKDLGLIKLPFPENLLKQEKLVEYLDRKIDIIDKIIKIKGEQFTNLSEQCKTLIYEVVTGKRKVK